MIFRYLFFYHGNIFLKLYIYLELDVKNHICFQNEIKNYKSNISNLGIWDIRKKLVNLIIKKIFHNLSNFIKLLSKNS